MIAAIFSSNGIEEMNTKFWTWIEYQSYLFGLKNYPVHMIHVLQRGKRGGLMVSALVSGSSVDDDDDDTLFMCQLRI